MLVIAAAPAAARADTVTVGSPLSAPFVPLPYMGNVATVMQTSLDQSGSTTTSPVTGTVTSWRVALATGLFKMRVIRPAGGGTYFGAATSAAQSFNGESVSAQIPTNLQIQAGDSIAIQNSQPTDIIGAAANNAISQGWNPVLPEGPPPSAPTFTFNMREYAFNATVRYCRVPDLVGKTQAEATQALGAAACTLGTVTRPALTKKQRRKRKVVDRIASQDQAVLASLSDGAPVGVTLKTKKKKKKKRKSKK